MDSLGLKLLVNNHFCSFNVSGFPRIQVFFKVENTISEHRVRLKLSRVIHNISSFPQLNSLSLLNPQILRFALCELLKANTSTVESD